MTRNGSKADRTASDPQPQEPAAPAGRARAAAAVDPGSLIGQFFHAIVELVTIPFRDPNPTPRRIALVVAVVYVVTTAMLCALLIVFGPKTGQASQMVGFFCLSNLIVVVLTVLVLMFHPAPDVRLSNAQRLRMERIRPTAIA